MDFIRPAPPLTRSSTRKITSYYKLAEKKKAHNHLALVENIYTSPGEGEKNVKWINKQFREAQDLIIRLRKKKRVSKLRFERNFKKCGPSIKVVYAAPTNSQSKLRRNALLFMK